jgi:tetratricopeptide (TPR) repeat protein
MYVSNLQTKRHALRGRALRHGLDLLVLSCGGLFLALGCGGGGGGGGGAGGGRTTTAGGNGLVPGEDKPKVERQISQDARADYQAALEVFQKREAEGWNRDGCESAASRFADVAAKHTKLSEAGYMAALSYDRCGLRDKAEDAYQRVLKNNGSHAPSLSNLGTLYFKAGDVAKAKQHWEQAIDADSKISAARNNLAWLLMLEMRKTADKSTWKKLEADAAKHLSSSLAVNGDLVETYVLYGLLYLEGSESNRNRLDLANLLLEEGAKRNDSFAPLYNAKGLLQLKWNNLGEALANFQKAVTLDARFVEARLNVGNITLGFRKYDEAEVQFKEVLGLQPNLYEAQIGLGIAQRGLGKLAEAEASYKKAIELDGQRGEAYFNLGVLYKDFYANQAKELKDSKKAYETARDHFRGYLGKGGVTPESKQDAQDNIADCEKIIKQLDEIIQATAQQG